MSQPSIAARASIESILDKVTRLLDFIISMRYQSSEHSQIHHELEMLQTLLRRAYSIDGNASAYWSSSIQFLTRRDSVFDQTTEVLDSLIRRLGGVDWPFGKPEAKRMWERIRRTNTSLDFALDSVVSRFHIPTTDTDADIARRLARSA